MTSDVGERIAAWLEDLDLAPHLAAAGLPTFSRDEQGRAVWTDPATDEPMTTDQLDALDVLLHADGDDPAYAVPVSLVQVAREARLRAELLASPSFVYGQLTVRGVARRLLRGYPR